MTTCRWDAEAGDYLKPDGDPCRTDDYGDRTKHCTARRTCSLHVGPGELTCARCLGRTRVDLAQIVERSDLLLGEAIVAGVDSEAANLAGPAADPEAWTWRKVAARQGRAWHLSLVEEDDEQHPYLVLGRWDLMLREDYDQPSEKPVTIANAAAYLDGVLGRVAQDPGQDFPLLARELRRCRSHLEAVLRDSRAPERGAPCPDCLGEEQVARLIREYGHWCTDEDCERIHYLDDSGDRWVCPRNPRHIWTHRNYESWIEEREEAKTGT